MVKKTISRDLPLAGITLRRYEKPFDMGRRALMRKLCLSVGLLQPGDSRDVVVDILDVLLKAKNKKKLMSSEEIKDRVIKLRKKSKLPMLGIASSNIRRQLKRLKDLFLIETIRNNYRITEFEDLSIIFKEKIEKFYLNSILERIRDYFKVLK